MNPVKKYVDILSSWVVSLTRGFIETKLGQLFLDLSLLGPVTFVPTVWKAWTTPNIDALRTLTWPTMAVVNIAVFISVCHNGDWRVRLSMVLWIILMLLTWLATIFR